MTAPDPTRPAAASPDVAFSLGAGPTPLSPSPEQQSTDLGRQIAAQLLTLAPTRWERVVATFAIAGTREHTAAFAVRTADTGELAVPDHIMAMVREHRELSARTPRGPWWRLAVDLKRASDPRIIADYGTDVPFADEYLFAPDAYREDLARHPRTDIPLWLTAHMDNGGRQLRDPSTTVDDQDHPVVVDLPELSIVWARWAVLSVARLLAEARHGAGIDVGVAWYETPTYHGSSLISLPGGRAVLSGGDPTSQVLADAYRRGEVPDLYRGAPRWVTNATLNHRARRGLLTFCYWFDGERWAGSLASGQPQGHLALPAQSSAQTVAAAAAALGREKDDALLALVDAAETGSATTTHLRAIAPHASAEVTAVAESLLDLAGALGFEDGGREGTHVGKHHPGDNFYADE